MKTRLLWVLLALSGIAALVALSLMLDREFGIPFDTSYRVACAGCCILMMANLAAPYRDQRWPWIALAIALLVNVGLLFSPLVHRPASRGEIMFFALPDAILLLVARIATYRVTDVHQRAVRQQLIFALVVTVIACIGLFALTLAN